jgi:hypothetical protein
MPLTSLHHHSAPVPPSHVNIRSAQVQQGRSSIPITSLLLFHILNIRLFSEATYHFNSPYTTSMGVSLSTARYLAPLSFAYDFAAQQYGLNSKPNMMDIHERNISFWSPNPYFIGAFFFPQQL